MENNWCSESKVERLKEIFTKPNDDLVQIFLCACSNCKREIVILTFDTDCSVYPRYCPICRSGFSCAL